MKSKLRIDVRGNKYWQLPNWLFHRDNGPAVEYVDGYKAWYLNGVLHREDSPAIEYKDDHKRWYLNNIEYSEKEHKKKMRLKKLEDIL